MNPVSTDSTVPQAAIATDAPIIAAHTIVKTYRAGFWLNQQVSPLKGVSLTVQPGETFGLLGPNGAGKTTLLKILLGIVRPSSGSGTVLGRPIGDRATKQRLGYLPENPYFYGHLTGWEYLDYAGKIFQLPASVRKRRIPELLDWVELDRTAARTKSMNQYSKGMVQRVGMAQALINDPDVVFLDEPMSGLDPLGRYQIREIILTLKRQGKTIFFNSHILSDVEKICDRVAILHQGTLLHTGALQELLGTDDAYRVRGHGGDLAQLDALLPQWLDAYQRQDDFWEGVLHRNLQDFLNAIIPTQTQLIEMVRSRPTLEQFFVRTIRAAQAQDQQVRD
jgi:ABC-2 type transport system ATP-binding protein